MQVKAKEARRLKVPADLSPKEVEAFDASVARVIEKGPHTLMLDCTALSQVTSSHVNMLWRTHLVGSDAGVSVRLASAPDGLIRVLKALDLYDLFSETGETQKISIPLLLPSAPARPTEVYNDSFCCSVESMNTAQAKFLDFLDRIQAPDMIGFELRTIFHEVTSNIHTYADLTAESVIELQAHSGPEKITLTFADSGTPFDPTSKPAEIDFARAARTGQKRGFGIVMLHKLTDHMTYCRKDGRVNELTVEKNWS